MSEDIVISVEIADRVYKVRVKKEEEQIFRIAVGKVKENISEYARNFAHKDSQDLLAMVLLQYVTSYVNMEQASNFKDTELENKLKEIDSILD
jgi:Cell division protein ZapA.